MTTAERDRLVEAARAIRAIAASINNIRGTDKLCAELYAVADQI